MKHAIDSPFPEAKISGTFLKFAEPILGNESGSLTAQEVALAILKRHLRLRARLQAAGKIDHDHVFFQDSGEPIRDLLCPAIRWRKSFAR